MSHFDQFRELVLREPSLQQELEQAPDFAAFQPLALKLAQQLGVELTAEDLEAAWRAAQRAWIERWI